MMLLSSLVVFFALHNDDGSVWAFQGPRLPGARASTKLHAASHEDIQTLTTFSDQFIHDFFSSSVASSSFSECDDSNLPPSLKVITNSIQQLGGSSSDIRGRFVNHPHLGSPAAIAKVILQHQQLQADHLPPLTPLAAHCIGYAFATLLKSYVVMDDNYNADQDGPIKIVVGRDPRHHGIVLADAFSRGAETVPGVQVFYTGLATTPAMASFCRMQLCHGAVMVTASHLPQDRNGFKFFSTLAGGTTASNFDPQQHIPQIIALAKDRASYWYDLATIPPTSGTDAIYCSGGWVDYMEHYKSGLKKALIREVTGHDYDCNGSTFPQQDVLKGLKLVLNAGNGSGGFFASVLEQLGADVSGSIHVQPDGNFPNGVPNPEKDAMIQETIEACHRVQADLGILLDTDADRCGLVAPTTLTSATTNAANSKDDSLATAQNNYQAIHRNKLIALLGVIFAHDSPGCAIVTCSVTSQGLARFLTNDLGLQHVRYLKGYANVISKAKTLTENGQANAMVAIETSGHCAMKENDFLDDGTYTAIKIVGLLAREKAKDLSFSLPSLIHGMKEMEEIAEIRMLPIDGTLESTGVIFNRAAQNIEERCQTLPDWTLDADNLEGIRVMVGNDGSFFMLRKSLHDPLLSLWIEAGSREDAQRTIVRPLLAIFGEAVAAPLIPDDVTPLGLDYQALLRYGQQ
jgi:phosphomannomutase